MKTLKAIYNFIVGDMIILVGILVIAVLLGLIANIGALAPLRVAIGPVLILAALVTLTSTLLREARGKR